MKTFELLVLLILAFVMLSNVVRFFIITKIIVKSLNPAIRFGEEKELLLVKSEIKSTSKINMAKNKFGVNRMPENFFVCECTYKNGGSTYITFEPFYSFYKKQNQKYKVWLCDTNNAKPITEDMENRGYVAVTRNMVAYALYTLLTLPVLYGMIIFIA